MKSFQQIIIRSLLLVLVIGLPVQAFAESDAKHKLVLQINSDDPVTQKIVLNNAANVQKHYGIDNVDVEVVAYGPGLGLLTAKSTQKDRVASLALQNIRFSACANTIKKIVKKTGKEPVLIDGVKVVPAGVVRIMELQEQGYAYVRP